MVRFRDDPARAELLALYLETDQRLAGVSCDSSTDCCHFGRTGREPYPTAVEVAEIEHAMRAAGGASAFAAARSRLPILPKLPDERKCPLLSAEGKCRVYASRPFGCRTFFCDRAVSADGKKLPRAEIQALSKRVAALSAKAFARDPGPRTLESAIERIRRGESVMIDARAGRATR